MTAAVEHALPFPKGYPSTRSADEILRLTEHLLVDRSRTHGIEAVALGDAEIPLEGAMRADMLMPLLVDYANQIILRQTELRFDSALTQELTTQMAVESALKESRLPTEADLSDADRLAAPLTEQGLLANTTDAEAGLGRRTTAQPAITMPVSVNLLILDAALEASVHQSKIRQQATLGQVESAILDLTPTYELLQKMDVDVPVLPATLHDRLMAILNADDPAPMMEQETEKSPIGADQEPEQ